MKTASTANYLSSEDSDADPTARSTSAKRRFSEEHARTCDSFHHLRTKEEVEAGWSPARLWVRDLTRHTAFDLVVGAVIVLNVVLMMIEADHTAACYPDSCKDPVISWFSGGFLVIYTIEASMRAYVDQRRYFRDTWNILDFSIVVLGWLDTVLEALTLSALEGMQKVPVLRVLRVVRWLRVLRLLKLFPELYVMIRGFLGAMKAMFWGFLLILVFIMIWSVVILDLVHPFVPSKNDPDYPVLEYCEDAFTGVFQMALLLFQVLVAGDAWGVCLLPIILRTPWTFIPFALALVSVSLGVMNLILVAIVDTAVEAHDVDKAEKAQQKKQSERKAIGMWTTIAKRLDKDGNGVLSHDEMMCAFEDDSFRATMESVGIDREDLIHMFELMDADESGDLDYDEFIHSFLKAHEMDQRVYMMMTKLQTDHMARCVKRIMESVKSQEHVKVPPSGAGFPPDTSSLASDFHSAPFDADFQRINESIQEQFNALTDLFKAAVQVSAQALPSAAALPEADSMPFGAGFECINEQIQEQFNALARSLEMNSVTLAHHTDALKAAIGVPDQVATAPTEECARHVKGRRAASVSGAVRGQEGACIVDACVESSLDGTDVGISI